METLNDILTNEYAFTFLLSAISIFIRSFTERQPIRLKTFQYYDVSLELSFISVSFVVSNLSQHVATRNEFKTRLTKLAEQKKGVLEGGEQLMAHIKDETIKITQNLAIQEHYMKAMYFVLGSLAVMLVIIILLKRSAYHLTDNRKFYRGEILPFIVGLFSLFLVLFYLMNNPRW